MLWEKDIMAYAFFREHWIHNSLSILGLAVYFKIDFTKILGALSSFEVPQAEGT